MARRELESAALAGAWLALACCAGPSAPERAQRGDSVSSDAGLSASADAGRSTSAAEAPAGGGTTARGPEPVDARVQGAIDAASTTAHEDAAGSSAEPVLAFPGAVGFGSHASGGRAGEVVHVTTLDDSGAGSFREAVSKPQRFVVFDVGGYIVLKTAVSVASDLTLAGQTAPGDGIGLMAREVSFSGSSNVIVRNLRFRQGTQDPDKKKSGINLLDTSDMIFDHVSIQFAQWNNIDAVRAKNVTFQYMIDADPIGQQFAAHTETGPFTWFHNLFANAHNRCPLAKANTQYVNNVVYDYQAGYTAGDSGGHFSHDVIGNYFIAGPRTSQTSNAFFQLANQSVYGEGNLLDGNRDGLLNGVELALGAGATALAGAWSPATAGLSPSSAAEAYADVLQHAGALPHDSVDALVLADVSSLGKAGDLWADQNKTGLDNAGYGTLRGGAPATDSDGDGMPDAWERTYGLDPALADAKGDFDGSGYTNLEKYVNGLLDGLYP